MSKENPIKSENQPLVSVGMPAYNRPEGLKRTLECITGQTYKNLEIIVSDNCSPDPKIEAVVKEFQKQDNRIQYYRQAENFDMGYNFKFVLEKATGEYFMWAADDDEWENDYIEKCLIKLINNKKMVLCYSEAILKNYKGQSEFLWLSDMETVGLSKVEGVKKVLLKQHRNTEIYGLMRRDIINKYKFRNTYGGDHIVVLHLALSGEIGKTQPGLFISNGAETSGSTSDNIVKVLQLNKLNLYFGFLYQMINMIKLIFIYDYKINISQKIKIIFIIFIRFSKPPYSVAICSGFKRFFHDAIKGRV